MRWQLIWLSQECDIGCGCWETAKPKVSEKGIMNRGHSMSKGTEEYTHTHRRKIIKHFKKQNNIKLFWYGHPFLYNIFTKAFNKIFTNCYSRRNLKFQD